MNVELNKPRPLPNAVDGIFGLFGLQICSLKLCGSVVDRISAVFKRIAGAIRESKDVKKTRETGLQLFQRLRAWQPQPQCVQAQLARALASHVVLTRWSPPSTPYDGIKFKQRRQRAETRERGVVDRRLQTVAATVA